MNRYLISVPIAGIVCISVEAENEEDAYKEVWNNKFDEDTLQWEMLEKLVEGNILYAPQNEMCIEDVEKDIDKR